MRRPREGIFGAVVKVTVLEASVARGRRSESHLATDDTLVGHAAAEEIAARLGESVQRAIGTRITACR